MKKAIIIVMSTVFIASCTPKRPVNNNPQPNTQAVITTTAIRTQTLNTSNTSQATNKTVTVKSTKAGEVKTNADGSTTTAKSKDTSIQGNNNNNANTNNNNNNNNNNSNDTTADTGSNEEENNNNAVNETENTGNEQNNGTSEEGNTDYNGTAETENGSEETADNTEDNKEITDITEASLEVPVVEAGEAIVELPAQTASFEESGFTIDYDTAKYSEEDGKTYAEAKYNDHSVKIGYDETTHEVTEIEFTEPTGIKIPGGFTVGDSIQAFRDHFGYWGGDIYNIGDAEYIVSGTDVIESIKIKYKKAAQ